MLIAEIDSAFYKLDRKMFDGLSEPDLERFRDPLTRMQTNLQPLQP